MHINLKCYFVTINTLNVNIIAILFGSLYVLIIEVVVNRFFFSTAHSRFDVLWLWTLMRIFNMQI